MPVELRTRRSTSERLDTKTALDINRKGLAMIDVRFLARALGGEMSRRQVLAPAIGHSHKDRSLCLRLDPRAPDGFLVHCFGSGNPLAEKDRIRHLLGLGHLQPGLRSCKVRPIIRPDIDEHDRAGRALSIWYEGCEPWGTPVEAYLRNRRLQIPENAVGTAIRYHPECSFAGKVTPAMVCLVRDIRTNDPKAIHRTALTRDGVKAEIGGKERLALGPVGGGAIKLTPDEDVTLCLGIGEGVESVLSLRHLPEFGPSPVWSLISAGGVESFPVLPGIESLWIAVDHDANGRGQQASRAAGYRWQAAGAEVFLKTPSAPGADLNDLFTAGVRDAS
jgi:hypothetical protein